VSANEKEDKGGERNEMNEKIAGIFHPKEPLSMERRESS
jgi:hypothetical protein